MLPESDTVAEAIRTRELSVVVDPFLTDTGRLATVVLPTTTLLEDDDLLGAYGHHYLGESRPVVPPPAGVKTDLEILQALAARVGLAEVMAGQRPAVEAAADRRDPGPPRHHPRRLRPGPRAQPAGGARAVRRSPVSHGQRQGEPGRRRGGAGGGA